MSTRARSRAGCRHSWARWTAAIAAVQTGMGLAWNETVVAVVTEFGRTARINGSEGTDHGTATVALIAGGGVKGGRVIADWPGLKEGRPLRETRPQSDHRLRAVLKGLPGDHPRVEDRVLAADLFPGSDGAVPIEGLLG
jgi:uncharacterized protein (DUF1501 family)